MSNKVVLAAVLAGLAGYAFAATDAGKDDATVTVRGVLQEDKNGFFLSVNDVIYDIRVNDESKADMHKFYKGLEGDLVQVSGVLYVEEVADKKPYLVLYTNDITRLKGKKVIVQQPIVREVYVEHPRRGIHLPGVHINW